MTTVSKFSAVIDELHSLIETKENPDEWYVVAGQKVGEYSIRADEAPDELADEEPPEGFGDANENVDGFYQIGQTGWASDAFAEDVNFVTETGFSDTHEKIDRRIDDLLLVHESQLSEKALEIASEKEREAAEA